MDELRAGIADAVRRVIADAVLHNHAVAQEVGLGASDAQFVGLLGQHGPLTPGRLAALTGLSTGTVTGVVDRLERGGFVRRERDTGDRRKVLVVLVPEGMQRLGEHYREHGEHLERVLATRSADELRTIAAFLDDLLPPR
ncbi:MAG: Transcriptional regulator, MarR family [uncultured Pseudonocardia sp.]|uniref:Transcriptional regulator, MarR family n=1 Tax=uncultured Pseudonocardia sp. TaxID=211455 RepID=A0A6J4NID8_9PSEU|nr:MAG: Transcriptional regulator, MarR family [uncultured Pseudonocardia sp.]